MSAIFCNGLQLWGFHCQQKQGQVGHGRTCPEKLSCLTIRACKSSLSVCNSLGSCGCSIPTWHNMANWAWSWWGRALVTSASYRLKEKFLCHWIDGNLRNTISRLYISCEQDAEASRNMAKNSWLDMHCPSEHIWKHQKYKWNLISHDPNISIEAVTRTFGLTGGFPGDRVEILVLTVPWLAAKGPNIQFLQTALYCISWPKLTYPKKSATMHTYFPRSKDTLYVSTWMHNNDNNHCIKGSYEDRTITDSANMPDSLRLLRQMLGLKCEIHLNHTSIDIHLGTTHIDPGGCIANGKTHHKDH